MVVPILYFYQKKLPHGESFPQTIYAVNYLFSCVKVMFCVGEMCHILTGL